MREIIIFTYFTLALGCAQSVPDHSKLKHEFSRLSLGETSRMQLDTCKQREYNPATATDSREEMSLQMQSSVSSYIKHLATNIMKRVNASLEADGLMPLFTGAFDPSNWCFSSSSLSNTSPNASMQTRNLTMNFEPSLIEKLGDESAIASVVCHELAHATMSHGFHDIDPVVLEQILEDNAAKQSLIEATTLLHPIKLDLNEQLIEKIYGTDSAQYKKLVELNIIFKEFFDSRFLTSLVHIFSKSKILTDQIFINDIYAKIFNIFEDSYREKTEHIEDFNLTDPEEKQWAYFVQNMDKILHPNVSSNNESRSEIFSPRSALTFVEEFAKKLGEAYHGEKYSYLNWKESQADEVGLELCARAGVDISKYGDFFAQLVNRFSSSTDKLTRCLKSIEADSLPARSAGSHPDPCWRLFDVSVFEPNAHQAEYEALTKRIEIRPLATLEMLEQVLKDIDATKVSDTTGQ